MNQIKFYKYDNKNLLTLNSNLGISHNIFIDSIYVCSEPRREEKGHFSFVILNNI